MLFRSFYAKELDARLVAHGDDFTILAAEDTIRWIYNEMSKRYKPKLRGVLGPDPGDLKEIIILNRILRWTSSGLEYEPDPRHAEMIIRHLESR